MPLGDKPRYATTSTGARWPRLAVDSDRRRSSNEEALLCPRMSPRHPQDPSVEPQRFEAGNATTGARSFIERAPSERISPRRLEFLTRLEQGGRYPTWVLMAALAGMFATSFPITILAVALGPIATEFGEKETTIAWVISAPMLLSAVAFPLVGKLGDLYGHRRIFLVGFSGATIVAFLTAMSWDALSLIGFRTAAAVLGGATQPTAMALIFSVYPAEDRVRAMGWWSMTTAAAPALGLIAGGPLIDLVGWRIVFLFQGVLSAIALALAVAILRETSRKRVRFDLVGAATLAIGVGALMFALSSIGNESAADWWIPTSLVVGALAIVSFVRVETRVTDPLLPLEFFRSRNFSATLITNGFTSAAYMGAFIIAPLFLGEQGQGFSATAVAYIMLMRTASLSLTSPLGGWLGERNGERWAATFGCGLMTVSLVLIAWAGYHSNIVAFAIGLLGQGAGHGLSQPSITAAISRSVDDSDLGIAASANRLLGQGGAAFGIATLTLAYGGVNDPSAFSMAFGAGAILSGISVITALFMGPERIVLRRRVASEA
jgi:EmrB/QacA subfamily drug resistance transporter